MQMQALVIGLFEPYEQQALQLAADRASTTLQFFSSFGQAQPALEVVEEDLTCVFGTRDECVHIAAWLRTHAQFFAVPIVALVSHPSDFEFQTAYGVGADDTMCRSDLGGVTRRLANLRDRPRDMRPPTTQGHAVVAFPDNSKRRVIGRTLRTAGFNVSYAAGAEELDRPASLLPQPTLIVTHPTFPELGGRGAVQRIRELTGSPALPALVLSAFPQEEGASRPDSDPQDTGRLLFFAEEALRGDGKVLRTSPRLHCNQLCAFREEGSLQPIFGLTHNISRQGLYVRTFDPPRPGSTLWFEMRAPGEDKRMVHLRGRVVWRREAKMMGGAAPAGFGMRIEEVLCPEHDLAYYQVAYDELFAETEHPELEPLSPAAAGGCP